MSGFLSRAGCLILTLACAACAPALREPPDPYNLSGQRPASRREVEQWLSRAATLYAERTLEGVRQAAELWMGAAAADHDSIEAWVGAMRSRIWLTERETERATRVALATEAVQAGQLCERAGPERPECAYWLAISIGVQARERHATALHGIDRMVERLERAIDLDPGMDHGGPHRVLALVYLRAPGWPTGPGDPDRALEQAQAAVAIDARYPPNQLCLAEARFATEDRSSGIAALERALSGAREALRLGEPDAEDWLEQAESELAARKGRG